MKGLTPSATKDSFESKQDNVESVAMNNLAKDSILSANAQEFVPGWACSDQGSASTWVETHFINMDQYSDESSDDMPEKSGAKEEAIMDTTPKRLPPWRRS